MSKQPKQKFISKFCKRTDNWIYFSNPSQTLESWTGGKSYKHIAMNEIMDKYYGERLKRVLITPNVFNIKPVKYYYKPRLIVKIPYLYIDKDWDTGKRGLFLGIHEIEIGKRKIKNENYKKQLKEWKKENNTVYFVNGSEFKFNLTNEKTK